MANRIKRICLLAVAVTLCCSVCTTSCFATTKKNNKVAIQNTNSTKHAKEHEELFKKAYIDKNDVLSVTDCVSIAFHNSPVIRRYKYNLDLAKSNVGIAKSEYFLPSSAPSIIVCAINLASSRSSSQV